MHVDHNPRVRFRDELGPWIVASQNNIALFISYKWDSVRSLSGLSYNLSFSFQNFIDLEASGGTCFLKQDPRANRICDESVHDRIERGIYNDDDYMQ